MVSKQTITKIIEEILNQKGITTKCSIIKSSPYYNTALLMSEKYGLRIKKCTRTELRFEDNSNHTNPLNENIKSTELRFDELLYDESPLDTFNEEDNSKISLDTILGYYTTMPQALKNSTSLIAFEDSEDVSQSTIYDPVKYHKENIIKISKQAFQEDDEGNNMERTMAHEMGHCLEMQQLTPYEKQVFSRIMRGVNTFDDKFIFDNKILPKMHTYSRIKGFSDNGGVFGDAVELEANEQGVELAKAIPSTYGQIHCITNHYFSEKLSEHFADTVSMVSFKNKTDKSNAKIMTGDYVSFQIGEGKVMDYTEYMGGQKHSIPVVEELLKINE